MSVVVSSMDVPNSVITFFVVLYILVKKEKKQSQFDHCVRSQVYFHENEYKYSNSIVVVGYFFMSMSTEKYMCTHKYEYSNSIVSVEYFFISTATEKCT